MDKEVEDGMPDWLSRPLTEESWGHPSDSVSMLWTCSMSHRLISEARENAVQNIDELRQLVEQWEAEEQAYCEASASRGTSSAPADVDQRFESCVQRFFAQRQQYTPVVTGPSGLEQGKVPLTAELVKDIYKKVKGTWQYHISPTDEQGFSFESGPSETHLAFPSLISRCVSSEYVEEERWKDLLYADRRPYMPVPPSYSSRRLADNRSEAFATLKEELFFELLRREQFAEAVRCSSSEDQGETDMSYVFKQDLAYRDSRAQSISTPGFLAPPRKPLYRVAHDDTATMSDSFRFLSTEDRFSFPLIADSEGHGLNLDIPSSVSYMDVIPENVFEELAEDDPATDMYRARPFLVLMDSPDGDEGPDSTNSSLTPKDALEFGVSSTESSQPTEQTETPYGTSEDDVVSPFGFSSARGACFRPLDASPRPEINVEESGASSRDFSSFSIEERSPMSSIGSTEGKLFTSDPEDSGLSQEISFLMPNMGETQIVSYTFMREDLVSAVYATEPSPTSSQTTLSNIDTIEPARPPQNTFDISEDDNGSFLVLPEEALIQEEPITPEHPSISPKQSMNEIDSLEKIGGDELVSNMYAAGMPHGLMKEELVSEVICSTSSLLSFDDTTLITQTSEITERYFVQDVCCQVDEGALSNDFQTSDITKHEVYGDRGVNPFSRGRSFSGGSSSQQTEDIEGMTPLMEKNLVSSFGLSEETTELDANIRVQQAPTAVEKNVTKTNTSFFFVKGRSPDLSVSNLKVPISASPTDVTRENVPQESITCTETPILSLVLSPNSSCSRSMETLSVAPYLSGSDSSLPTEKTDWSVTVMRASKEGSSEQGLPAKAANMKGTSQNISLPVDFLDNGCCQEGITTSLDRRGDALKSKVKRERTSLGSNSGTVQIPLRKEMLPVLGTVIQVMESILTASGATGQLISRLGEE